MTTLLPTNPKRVVAEIESFPELVSVIIPNYNHAHYVGEAIQSVLHQTYRNVEIIVVDDGSTDESQEVIASFGNHVHYIWQENRGLSAARNRGIAAAKGAYIALLDADDMYEPTFLATLIAALHTTADASGIYCGYQFVDHNNCLLPQLEARTVPDGQLYQALVDGNFLVPESILVRRECYANVAPFDEALRACEDWDMWLTITRQYKIIGTTQVLTRHRILPGSMSTNPQRMLTNRMAVLAKHFGSEPTDATQWVDVQRRAYGCGYLVSTVEHLQCYDLAGAYTCFQKMVYADPTLLTELGTFYELGCGCQPKGFRGHFASLDIEPNGATLFGLLDRFFSETQDCVDNLDRYRSAAYANAYFAFGLLGYGAQRFQEARHFLFHAIIANPSYLFNRQLVFTLFKLLLGVYLVNQLKMILGR